MAAIPIARTMPLTTFVVKLAGTQRARPLGLVPASAPEQRGAYGSWGIWTGANIGEKMLSTNTNFSIQRHFQQPNLSFFFFFFCPNPQSAEVPRPGIEPVPQLWQCQNLNLLCHKETASGAYSDVRCYVKPQRYTSQGPGVPCLNGLTSTKGVARAHMWRAQCLDVGAALEAPFPAPS